MGFVALGNAAWDDPWCTPTLVEGVKGISRTGSRSSSIGDMACRLQVSLKGADCGGGTFGEDKEPVIVGLS